MNCPFCTINPAKNVILKEGNNVRVIFSNPRLMPGHLLVIPKRHVEKISELNEEEKKELFDTTVEFQEKILSKFADGCDIRQHYRPFCKQDDVKVDHLHIHLQPRKFEDELYKKVQVFERNAFKEVSPEELKKLIKIFE